MYNFSCKGCTDRKVGCHSKCEKYLAESAENVKNIERIHKVKEEEFAAVDFLVEGRRKNKRKYERR